MEEVDGTCFKSWSHQDHKQSSSVEAAQEERFTALGDVMVSGLPGRGKEMTRERLST